MKIATLKNAFLTALFLVAAGHAGIAPAHSVSGALGNLAGATDVYLITCSNEEGGNTPTYSLSTQVRDNAPVAAPPVSVLTSKDGKATNIMDNNGDGNSRYSSWVYNNRGNGIYTMIVTKSAAGAEKYTVEFHCQGPASSGYIHTGTIPRQTQNQ